MRTFFIFKIKAEYQILTKNQPYLLFKMLKYIYQIDKDEIKIGANLFYKLVDTLNNIEIDNQILKKHQNDYFYTKYQSNHQIHNLYQNEHSILEVHKHFLVLKSSVINPKFLKDIDNLNNLFICDFKNLDYFWLDKLPV